MNKIIRTFIMSTILLCAMAFGLNANAANENSFAAKVTTQSTALNIRAAADMNSAKLISAEKGTYLTVMSKHGEWYKVEYAKGKYGYCHGDFITKATSSFAAKVNTAESALNVRSGKGTGYAVKETLPKGTYVVVLKVDGDWTRILYSGNKTGYVNTKYLKRAVYAYKKIALDVPSFKQTDSRWANIKIGTQGDTLYTSGCTTTALAMTESYRLKQTVTPKDMVSRLSYSSSGMLYWPHNYNVVLADSSTYLKEIYTLLKSGKPVVFGMKKANGSQHWVVVTGYGKDSSTLSKSNFTINDPGSNTRTNLSQVMSLYPNVYKIVTAK